MVRDGVKGLLTSAHIWLLFVDEREKELSRLYSEVLKGGSGPPDGMPRGSGTSDPTRMKAIKLADYQDRWKWVALIRELEKEWAAEMLTFVELRRKHRYYTKQRGWYRPVVEDYVEAVAEQIGKSRNELRINRDTMYEWWKGLVGEVAIAAAMRGLK